jgi:hypothetical protein
VPGFAGIAVFIYPLLREWGGVVAENRKILSGFTATA